MDNNAPALTKVTRKRQRGPNFKSGCVTCRIRRKKCDGTRPACFRCTSTGRKCDLITLNVPSDSNWGLDPVSTRKNHFISSADLRGLVNSPKLLISPRPFQDITKGETGHFEYFIRECTHEFSNYFDASLWKRIIPQAASSEPFVLQTVLAIGALRRSQLESSPHAPNWKAAPAFEYSIKKYNSASRLLREQIKSGAANRPLTILGSLAFLAIDVLQGHEEGALIHIQNGVKILQSMQRPKLVDLSGNTSPRYSGSEREYAHVEDLAAAYTRLSIDEYPFVGLSRSAPCAKPILSYRFDNLEDARDAMNKIMMMVFSLFRRLHHVDSKPPPTTSEQSTISTDTSNIKITLQSWRHAFDPMLLLSQESSPGAEAFASTLIIQYLSFWIRVSTAFCIQETIYDQYLPQFVEIIDRSQKVIEYDRKGHLISKSPCFTLNNAMVQPLYFVARKCREHSLRRIAISMMHSVGQDGLYTGRTVARVAKWIVDMEEGDATFDGYVREERRFNVVHFELDRVQRTGHIRAYRWLSDGTSKEFSTTLDLSKATDGP